MNRIVVRRKGAFEAMTFSSNRTCDVLIVGGGPAGLTAAVYLARARRSVVVVDCAGPGRSDWAQANHNYLGFPDGMPIVELCERGRQQAMRFGVQFFDARVESIRSNNGLFVATTDDRTLCARIVILATGVEDRWASFPGYDDYIGRSLHWCSVCDGYEMRGQRVVVMGNSDDAAEMAIQLSRHADQVTVLTNDNLCQLSSATIEELSTFRIPVVVGRLDSVRAKERGWFQSLLLESGVEIPVDHVFSVHAAAPNAKLIQDLNIRTNDRGYIEVDTEAKTNIEGVYAAGDVTGLFSRQVLSAAHEGATAAMAAEYALFQRDLATHRNHLAVGA